MGSKREKTESDADGRYTFESVPPGTYTVEVKASGLEGKFGVEVKPSETSIANLMLAITEMRSNVTVTAENPGLAIESEQSTTIEESTVEDAPNRTEHFDSLLRLVPGVVRGRMEGST